MNDELKMLEGEDIPSTKIVQTSQVLRADIGLTGLEFLNAWNVSLTIVMPYLVCEFKQNDVTHKIVHPMREVIRFCAEQAGISSGQ